MPICLLCPTRLSELNTTPDEDAEPLEVTDRRDDYYTEDGDGVWIGAYLEFIEKLVRTRCHQPDFSFSDYDCIAQDVLDEIPDLYTRKLVIAFTNEHFEQWRDKDVSLPNYDDIRSDCRSYCDDCESGWSEIHGEYDGPLADDVEDNEDENEAGIDDHERTARHRRNTERERERERRRTAQEDAENEVVDRDFNCDQDCDGFYDHVSDAFRDNVDLNTSALKGRWKDFLAETGESVMPVLIPEEYASTPPPTPVR